MLSITKNQRGELPQLVWIVAFNPANGQVHGTFVHGSYGPEPEGVARSRERLLSELRRDLGAKAKIETLEVPSTELPPGVITRVDVKARRLITEKLDRDAVPGASLRTKRTKHKAPKRKRPARSKSR